MRGDQNPSVLPSLSGSLKAIPALPELLAFVRLLARQAAAEAVEQHEHERHPNRWGNRPVFLWMAEG
jgi:hypothetical protein